MGRNRKEKNGVALSEMMFFRATPEEKKEMKRQAENEGYTSLSDFIRKVVNLYLEGKK